MKSVFHPWSFLLLLYSLFNKIRDKGKIVSAGYRGVGGRGEVGRGKGKGVEMTQTLYAHMNKKKVFSMLGIQTRPLPILGKISTLSYTPSLPAPKFPFFFMVILGCLLGWCCTT
jgi:hypothetical protein